MFMTDQQSPKLSEPRVGSFHDPATAVAAEFAAIFVPSFLVVLAMEGDQFDAPLAEPMSQRIGVVPRVGDHPLRFLTRAAAPLRDRDFAKRGFRKPNFCWRGTLQQNSQRNPYTVCQYYPLRSLAPLGFADGRPLFSGRKTAIHETLVPAQQAVFIQRSQQSAPCLQPNPLLLPALPPPARRGGRILIRQQSPNAAPVCRIQRMPSKQARFGAAGLRRLSARRLGRGNKSAINSHCSSVNSFCRFFMAEAQPKTCLTPDVRPSLFGESGCGAVV